MREKDSIRKAKEIFNKHCQEIPINVEDLLKKHDLQLVKKDLDDEISGMLVLAGNQKLVVINQNQSPQRQRFTALHELGHFILHQNENDYFIDTTIKWRKENQTDSKRYQEVQANEFAANLLMPESELERIIEEEEYDLFGDKDVAMLAKKFKCSRPAMKIRLASLGYIADWDI